MAEMEITGRAGRETGNGHGSENLTLTSSAKLSFRLASARRKKVYAGPSRRIGKDAFSKGSSDGTVHWVPDKFSFAAARRREKFSGMTLEILPHPLAHAGDRGCRRRCNRRNCRGLRVPAAWRSASKPAVVAKAGPEVASARPVNEAAAPLCHSCRRRKAARRARAGRAAPVYPARVAQARARPAAGWRHPSAPRAARRLPKPLLSMRARTSSKISSSRGWMMRIRCDFGT